MRAAVIISTYNSPEWLTKVFWGFEHQTRPDFEILVADDGSGPETAAAIHAFRNRGRLKIDHVWHEDLGFRKTKILNRAVRRAEADYLIFTDGDCVPRADFVETHCRMARPGYFLGGTSCRLTLHVSQILGEDDIRTGRAFRVGWLLDQGQPSTLKTWRLGLRPPLTHVLRSLTFTYGIGWRGGNSSAWRDDIFRVNGFDERMSYGAEDTEFGVRLANAGVRPVTVRYDAICLHLDHERGYFDREAYRRNRELFRKSRSQKLTWTDYGIENIMADDARRAA